MPFVGSERLSSLVFGCDRQQSCLQGVAAPHGRKEQAVGLEGSAALCHGALQARVQPRFLPVYRGCTPACLVCEAARSPLPRDSGPGDCSAGLRP